MMTMNRVQFQAGLSMAEFLQLYGTEDLCRSALEQMRWPNGFRCPRCECSDYSRHERDQQSLWQCRRCRHQASLLAGTVFQASKLPLRTWFMALHLLTQSKNNLSALALKRQLGVAYKTAWLIKHKLMDVMADRESRRVLTGRVEIDDAYLGGERSGGKVGRGSENKVPFVAAVQTNEKGHPLFVRFDTVAAFTGQQIATWSARVLSAQTVVWSDGLHCFNALAANVAEHKREIVGSGRQSVKHPNFRWVNTLLGNLKRALSGTYHAFNFAKYARRYLAEYAYRFNRRFDLKSLLPRLLNICVKAAPRCERQIRLAEVRC
jgi:ribosomal protein L37AE/L43A